MTRPTKLVAFVSLLLCVAVAGAWVRSYLPEKFYARSYRGQVYLIFAAAQWQNLLDERERSLPTEEVLREIHGYASGHPGAVRGEFAGFVISLSDRNFGAWMFAVPYWALALPPAAAAAWALYADRTRRRREKAGQCRGCGYNLTGNTTGVCPECGRAT